MNLRHVRSVAVVVLAIAAGVVVPATAATAHTDVVSTLPSAGAVLDSAPTSVAITFNEDLLEASVEAAILDSSGALITSVMPEVDGTVVTIPWPSGLSAGTYEVAYRVASGDGHPVTGSLAFSVTTELALAPPVGATPFAPDPATLTPAAAEAGGVSVYPFALVFLLVVAAIAGGTVALRRGRR